MFACDELWRLTRGDPRVCVAILDGPVDLAHSSLAGARLRRLPTLVPGEADGGWATQHGTHVASLIFGQPKGPVVGIAPECRGLVLPIFASAGARSVRPCSQLDLARALTQALTEGAQVVNLSGGEFTPGGEAHPLLAAIVEACARADMLIVAAAGNEGCACPHVPAALDTVLAVGACDKQGEPLVSSNWGGSYQRHGIVAPGANLLGAQAGGGTIRRSGTSFAAAVVSGVVALLLSLQVQRGQRPSSRRVREALLKTALDCTAHPAWDCRRLLLGRLNIPGALAYLLKETPSMTALADPPRAEAAPAAPNLVAPLEPAPPQPTPTGLQAAGTIEPSACCAACAGGGSKVYVLGQLGYDLISEARLDAFAQKMANATGEDAVPNRLDPFNTEKMLAHLAANPYDAPALEWILLLDGTAVYALRPQGAYASDTYRQLSAFLKSQMEEGVERISVPGVLSGSARLLLGQVVPVIVPELRGMYSWSTKELVSTVVGAAPKGTASAEEKEKHASKTQGVRNFLDKVYYGLRNLGVLPQDRAINFAATNAFNFEWIYENSIKEKMELESINVTRSPFCRPGSDCWDVEVYFFYPDRQVQTVRKVYRFTVDVSDVVPVTIGPTRSWFTR
jgi:hypothetical protein